MLHRAAASQECTAPIAHYARLHNTWRERRRLIFLCSASAPMGAFLHSVEAAFNAALLLERALILDGCKDTHAAAELQRAYSGFFEGRDLDWSASGLGDAAASGRSIFLPATKRLPSGTAQFNRTHAMGEHVGSAAVHLHVDEHSHIVARYDLSWHCLLHALLAPRPALLALVPSNLRDGPYSALHVRLGDGNMNKPGAVHAQSTWLVGKPPLAWHWLNESRPLESGFSRSAPSGLLRCFATALPAPHVVISDTEAVLAAAERLGMHTTRALGVPINLGMAGVDHTAGDVRKLFADWWLLANAHAAASVGYKNTHHGVPYSSQFIWTARRWHDEGEPIPPYRLACERSHHDGQRKQQHEAKRFGVIFDPAVTRTLTCSTGCAPQ